MSYEELSLSGFINEIKDVSSGPHPRKFCFVLGAGSSITSGIKSGQKLVDIWEKELLERNRDAHLKWKNEKYINDENMYSFYSQYYERRFWRKPSDGYNYLEKLMEHAKPSIGYVMLAYLLTKPSHNVVITTNFDHLVEDAVNYYAQTIPLIIGHESLSHYITRQTNRPTIIKIHRDLLFDPKNTADELENLHDNWKKALGIIFSEYHPIFIGYAGNDNSLMNFLIKNSEKFLSGEWAFPYWMLYDTDKLGGKVLEFLEATNGYLIKHSGFDEVMYMLGATLDYKLPSKEEFLNDAEKRFKMLSDYIDDFTEKSAGRKEDAEKSVGHKEEAQNAEDFSDKNTESSEIDQAVQQITSQTELQRLYREAVILNNTGKYAEALQIEKQLIEKEPENARYVYCMGVTLTWMKRYEEALDIQKRVIELEPENARYHEGLGVTLHALKNYEEALTEKKKAIELEPENARYYNSCGFTLYVMGRYEEALIFEEKAIELEPENAEYYAGLSTILHAMGNYEEAVKAVEKAIELEPQKARYYDSLSNTLHAMENYEEAVKAVEKAIELEPENAEYYDSLSGTLHVMGRYKEALKAVEKAIELEPQKARYYDSLSNTLHAMGNYEEALEAVEKAVKLEPENAEYYDSLSGTLHVMGRYKEALKAVEKAIELNPDNSKYKVNYEKVLEKMNNDSET